MINILQMKANILQYRKSHKMFEIEFINSQATLHKVNIRLLLFVYYLKKIKWIIAFKRIETIVKWPDLIMNWMYTHCVHCNWCHKTQTKSFTCGYIDKTHALLNDSGTRHFSCWLATAFSANAYAIFQKYTNCWHQLIHRKSLKCDTKMLFGLLPHKPQHDFFDSEIISNSILDFQRALALEIE